MCRNFGHRPSEIIGLRESSIAVDFDVAAALAVEFYTQEVEESRAAALMTAGAMNVLGGGIADDLPGGTAPLPGMISPNTQLV